MTEQWRQSPSWPAYEVSDQGRVRRLAASRGARVGHVLSACTDDDGYKQLSLRLNGRQKMVKVHHLVLEAFVGPRPGPRHVCRHGPNGPSDNHVGNLSWGTYADNEADKIRDGTANYVNGEQHGAAKLTEAQVAEIRSRYAAGGITHRALALEYGVSHAAIGKIIRGQRWRHFGDARPGDRAGLRVIRGGAV